MANHANAMNKVKILVVGDSGVGKSSLVHLICHGQSLSNSSWTIGCSVEVRVHEYREGTPSQRPYFVELWDVGGSNSHRNARHVFYNPIHGIILVHDLTNRKSQLNLRRWLSEVLLREGSGTKSRIPLVDDFDAEQFGGFSQLPVFVVGTKQDQIAEFRTSGRVRSSSIADECGADEISVVSVVLAYNTYYTISGILPEMCTLTHTIQLLLLQDLPLPPPNTILSFTDDLAVPFNIQSHQATNILKQHTHIKTMAH